MKLLWFLGGSLGSSILIHSSVGGRSHIKAMLEVGQTLAERGHSVRYAALTDNMRFTQGYPNISQAALGLKGFFTKTVVERLDFECGNEVGSSFAACFGRVVIWWISESYRMEYMPLLEHVEKDMPDLMVCDFFANACLDIAEAHAIPLVMGIQALDWIDIFNAPFISKDTRFGHLTIENMSLFDKILDTTLAAYSVEKFWESISNAISKERVLVGSKASWMPKGAFHYGIGLANSFFGFEVAQPLTPNIRAVGPILSNVISPLDPSLDEFLKKHKRVMLVAFGSLLSLQTREITSILSGALEAMEEGYIDGLIWGLGRTSLANFPNKTTTKHDFLNDHRFQLLSWVPQQSILNHPSTVVFLSHGGLESSFEAINSRTPVLNFPFLADQAKNAAKLHEMGVGVYIDPLNINIAASTKALLEKPDLELSLVKANALVKPHKRRLQEATNYVEDHLELAQACRPYQPYIPGGTNPPCEISHLLSASTRMSFIRANRIDVYAIVSLVLLALISTLISLVWYGITSSTPHQKSHKKKE
ncbi:hypothetical protein DSO57_1021627 [Entomophthora muscae]|uniref:Uncharacterized protein n=1 Tax=Entomophthora muscae TaxID=34485 RepID=A0ACC2S5J6_9FUNG|nr:hypothetical protein DSO57_1021627 [Entomophthora muscae]